MEFGNFKRKINDTFKALSDTFDLLSQYSAQINKENVVVKVLWPFNEMENVTEIRDNMKIKLEMISRDKMKCVFFGKTSNGKSATINAILGDEVLPSNIGRTTSCFITIEGCNESCGYIVDKNNERRRIRDINDIASELEKDSLTISSEIKLFWPKDHCDFLKSEIKLLDSPGVDYSPKNNKWIETYCQDADVFVYAVDATATINESERVFFRRVKYLHKTPVIIILMNKWDQCIQNRSASELITLKEQHLETARKFMSDDLRLTCDINKRVFFVSATDALEHCESNADSTLVEEFNAFVRLLQEELSTKAIINKFRPHIISGIEYIDRTLTDFQSCVTNNECSELQESVVRIKIQGLVSEAFEKIRNDSTKQIDAQYNFISSSFGKGDGADYYDKMAIDYSQKFIIKVLQDSFRDNVGKLSLKIKDELSNCGPIKIPSSVLDHYLPSAFDEYITTFDSNLPGQVYSTASRLHMTSGNTKEKKDNEITPSQYIAIASIIATNVLMMKSTKAEELLPAITAINEGLQKTLNDKKTDNDDKKPEVKQIPEVYVKPLIIHSLMQYVNQAENAIKKDINNTLLGFIKDVNELYKTLKEFNGIRKRLLENKVKIEELKDMLDNGMI